MAKRPRLNL